MSKKTITQVHLVDIPAFSKANIEKSINNTLATMSDVNIKSVSINSSSGYTVAVITYDTVIDDEHPEN